MELQTNYPSRRQMGRNRKLFLSLFLAAVFVLGMAISGVLWFMAQPSWEKAEPFADRKFPVVYKGEILPEDTAFMDREEILLSLDFIKEKMDSEIHWDKKSKSVIMTTKDKVLRFPEKQIEAFVNDSPFELRTPVVEMEGKPYIPFGPLEKVYPYRVERIEDTGIIRLEKSGDMSQLGKTLKNPKRGKPYFVRTDSSNKAPFVAELQQGTSVEIFGEKNGWYRVQLKNGIVGFIDKKEVELEEIQQISWNLEEKEFVPWNPLGGKINLTWEHVVSRNPNPEKMAEMPGLNVLSPTWFQLENEQGDIASKGSLAYVDWAHQKGYQVWALFSNNFNPDFTTEALSSFETRSKMVRQLLQYAEMYKLDGFNLDFENVYLKDKDALVQFVRELSPYLHEKGLAVSIDVTIKSQSEQWSLFYDRARLAEAVDYMMVMTYDEHWASSPVAGSVASLGWVEKGLQGVLEEVPPSKLLLGVPYYTRLWKEEKDANGKVKVSSKALSMEAAQAWMRERNLQAVYDEASGQNYVEFMDPKDGNTYKMWLEDEQSIRKRAELVKKYNLAGIASWRRGFEQPEIWHAISSEFKKRP